MNRTFDECALELVAAGSRLYVMGMVPATSGNFSARASAERIAITESGKHKGQLTLADIMQVDPEGRSLDGRRPSAETALHMQIYRNLADVNVVLHHHSAAATVISQLFGDAVRLADYEVLKAFPDVDTHETSINVPIFDNSQDIAFLAAQVEDYMLQHAPVYGYLIRGHGLYTWGESAAATMNHVEAFEFMFKCELMKRGVKSI